jgi:uncharacterized protein YuzE
LRISNVHKAYSILEALRDRLGQPSLRHAEVAREELPPHPVYLYYSRNAVARTQTLDDDYSVNVDFDSSGEAVGVEIVAPDDETIAIATHFALDHDLSLVGVFDPRAISA